MGWTSLIDPVSTLLDKFIPDKDEANRLAYEINTLAEKNAQALALGQIDVNKKAAQHKSLFVAGGRPAAVWVCVVAMAFNFILLPVALMALTIADIDTTGLAALDISQMMPILLGLLGLGGMRSFEKAKGVAREQ